MEEDPEVEIPKGKFGQGKTEGKFVRGNSEVANSERDIRKSERRSANSDICIDIQISTRHGGRHTMTTTNAIIM